MRLLGLALSCLVVSAAGAVVAEAIEILHAPVGRAGTLWQEFAQEVPQVLLGAMFIFVMVLMYRRRAARAQRALGRQRERLWQLVQGMPHGLIEVSLDGRLLLANPAYSEMLGCGEAELLGRNIWLHAAGDAEADALKKSLRPGAVGADPESIVTRMRRRDGQEREIRLDWARRETECGPILVAVATDVTDYRKASRRLQEIQQRYRALFESNLDGIILSDPSGKVVAANYAACRILGRSEDELLRLGVGAFIDLNRPQQLEVAERICRSGGFHGEVEFRRADGEPFPVEIAAARFEGGNGEVRIGTVIRDISERRAAQTRLQASREELRRLSGFLQKAQENERRRIARELHDELGQCLTALKMNIAWLRAHVPESADDLIGRQLSRMDYTVATTVEAVRRLSANLRPVLLDELGLTAACEWLVEDFRLRTGIDCRLEIDPPDMQADDETATACYRVVQEALTNVARHAQASRVDIRLVQDGEWLRLMLGDDGVGLPQPREDPGRFGLVGMRERVHTLGGRFELDSQPGEGTRILAAIPLTPAPSKESA
jgi:PAS domain S-box-containing protein